MARRPHAAPPPKKEGPRINREIRTLKVLLIDADGEKQGEMPLDAALEAAQEAGLDLVEVSPNANPPVCKIVDYGKLKYQEQKKKAEAKKKQKTQDVKEIKMRPNIDIHDYQVKTKAMTRFFEEGDKVKVTLRFRGREMAHQDRGMVVMNRVRDDFGTIAKVELEPKLEGRQMIMVMAPR
ncbi:translation initiation factor IF-3 [Maricaulaceae bacterium MS644]